MGVLFKDLTQLLSESALADTIPNDEEVKGLLEQLEGIDELDVNIVYAPEMIPVFQESMVYGDVYMVECQDLYRYAKSNNVDEVTALEHICECNKIDIASTYVIIESIEDINDVITEAKSSKGKKSLKKASKTIEKFREKGINLIKKKCK